MVTIAALMGLVAPPADSRFEALRRQHIEFVMRNFWNSEYRIVNEYLRHDYNRCPGTDVHMLTGHAIETLWLVMAEAQRCRDQELFETAAERVRHLLEMCWDYVFDGLGDGNFQVFGTKSQQRGPGYDVKTMWAHCEAMVACMMVIEHTGASWACQWYERLRTYTLRVMPVPGHGVWRQAIDRCGKNVKRIGVSAKRKDNFHQARYLMLNLLSLERMLARQP